MGINTVGVVTSDSYSVPSIIYRYMYPERIEIVGGASNFTSS